MVSLLHDKTKNEKNNIIEIKEIKEPIEDKIFNKKKKIIVIGITSWYSY